MDNGITMSDDTQKDKDEDAKCLFRAVKEAERRGREKALEELKENLIQKLQELKK